MPTNSYSAKFEQAGDYYYLCSSHPYMTGKIVIMEHQAASVLPIE